MTNDMFVEKAKKILLNMPEHYNIDDKVRDLNRRFRLNRKESKLLIRMAFGKNSG